MRILSIDGFRGFCLLMVAYTHCHYVLASWLGQVNYGMFLRVDPTAGFVSISGFIVAVVATGLLGRRGIEASEAFLRKRLRVLVIWHLASILFVVFLSHFVAVPSADMGSIGLHPVAGPILIATFVMPDAFFDVLTMYFFFLLLSPLALRLCDRSSPWTLVTLSLSVWLIGQTNVDKSLVGEFVGIIERIFGGEWSRNQFRILNWQTVYFLPFALGFAFARDRTILQSILKTDAARHLFYVCAGTFSGLLILRMLQVTIPSSGFLTYLWDSMDVSYNKQSVAGGFLVTFAMGAYLFTYMLSQGTAEVRQPIRIVSQALHRFFSLPILVQVGQASIYVFATNTMYVYLLIALDAERFGETAKVAFMAGAIVLAFIVAKIAAIVKARPVSRRGGPVET